MHDPWGVIRNEYVMLATLKISKLDAARRQLEMAIELYFLERDPVSIHTLAGAVYQLLSDLNKHRGGKPMVMEASFMKQYIVPGKEKLVMAKLAEAENFFKHADRDPEKVIDFRPESNEHALWEACIKYVEMTGEQTHSMQAMNLWFQLQHPEVFKYEDWKKRYLMEGKAITRSIGRSEFYRHVMALKLKG